MCMCKDKSLSINEAVEIKGGKRIRGLASSLRVESLHSGRVASSFATEKKVEELQGTVGELKGTVGNSGDSRNVYEDLDDIGNIH
ncbi:hypothetical protein ACE6H2_026325 [Prunus campanulata]